MDILFRHATIYRNGQLAAADVLVGDGRIISVDPDGSGVVFVGVRELDCQNQYLLPGLIDVHVHLREPGYSYKETIASGTRAAAHGGFTSVCAMPNLSPVPDSPEHMAEEIGLIRRDALIRVYPYAAVTVGERGEELSDMRALSQAAVAFSDDGRGIQDGSLMRAAMQEARRCGKLIAAHCEDNALLRGGYIHDGAYARQHHHRGICSESEWRPIARDLRLADETGCAYHVCHVSTKESVALIRGAKAVGIDVTCETAPHYLLLSDGMLEEDGRFKMNPPLRSEEDRLAVLEGLLDGTVDMIATDHAPHAAEEKSRGLKHSLMGVVGLETALPVLYTELVKPGIVPLTVLLDRMHDRPSKRFGIGHSLEPGAVADLTLFDFNQKWVIRPEEFQSMGRSTPFAGRTVYGECQLTLAGGNPVYEKPSLRWITAGGKQ